MVIFAPRRELKDVFLDVYIFDWCISPDVDSHLLVCENLRVLFLFTFLIFVTICVQPTTADIQLLVTLKCDQFMLKLEIFV